MPDSPGEELERQLQDTEFKKLFGAADAKDELAQALYRVREALGLTQKEMATRLQVSQPYVAKLESGEANPTIGSVGTMLAELDLRIRIKTESLFSPSAALPTLNSSTGAFVFDTNALSSLNSGYALATGARVFYGHETNALHVSQSTTPATVVTVETEAGNPWEAKTTLQREEAEAVPVAA